VSDHLKERDDEFDVSEFQWLCFAYKMPSTTELGLQLRYKDKGDFQYNLGGGYGWGYRLDHSFNLIKDNEWHHTCTNLYEVTLAEPLNPFQSQASNPETKTFARDSTEVSRYFQSRNCSL
jgi:hypothetical protein